MAKRHSRTVRINAVIVGLLLAGIATAGRQVFRDQFAPDEIVSDTYFSADSGEIKLVGVCDVLSPQLQCWNYDRSIDNDLTKQVAERLAKGGANPGSDPIGVPFFFRRKNRLAVFQVPIDTDQLRHSTHVNGFFQGPNRYLQAIAPPQYPPKDPGYQFYALSADKSQSTISVLAMLQLSGAKPILMPLKSGAEAKIGDRTISIESIGRNRYAHGLSSPTATSKSWSYLFKITADSPTSRLQVSVSAVDENGRSFVGIDKDGRPLKFTQPTKGVRFNTASSARNPFPYFGSLTGYQPNLGGRVWTTPIDPKYLPNLNIYFSTALNVQFKDIPLDPK